jgi:hypothetical protein
VPYPHPRLRLAERLEWSPAQNAEHNRSFFIEPKLESRCLRRYAVLISYRIKHSVRERHMYCTRQEAWETLCRMYLETYLPGYPAFPIGLISNSASESYKLCMMVSKRRCSPQPVPLQIPREIVCFSRMHIETRNLYRYDATLQTTRDLPRGRMPIDIAHSSYKLPYARFVVANDQSKTETCSGSQM